MKRGALEKRHLGSAADSKSQHRQAQAGMSSPIRGAFTLFASLALIVGCSTGAMKVNETYYLAVPGKNNTNYYRVRIDANTVLGKSEYHSGWYPADVVDSLYGDTSSGGSADAYKTQKEIRESYNLAIKTTIQGYLTAASNPKSDPSAVQAWLVAQRQVRAMPGETVPLPKGAVEIEYDPSSSLGTRHAGEKLVFVLSSDPDEIIGEISRLSSDTQTSATILSFADVVRQQSMNQVDTLEVKADKGKAFYTLIALQIDDVLELLKEDPSRSQLIGKIQALRSVVENAR